MGHTLAGLRTRGGTTMYAASFEPVVLESRENNRVSMCLEVSGETGHQFFTGFTENVSAGGLFIATYQCLPIRSRLHVSFRVPGLKHQFECDAEVRWIREFNESAPHVAPGMGVSFLNLSAEETAALNMVLHRLEPIFYDA